MNYFPDEVGLGLVEIPGEISLIIPFAGCGFVCQGCHSPHYQNENNGMKLSLPAYNYLLDMYKDKATCVCFFGHIRETGDWCLLTSLAKERGYKTALYTGATDIPYIMWEQFDYVKTGRYIAALGGLDKPTTNQVLWKKEITWRGHDWQNITSSFWTKEQQE